MAKQIAGPTLTSLIGALPKSAQIKVVRSGHPARKMNVDQVLILVKSIAFVGVLSGTRLRHVREVEAPATEWKACWGTTQAAVCPPTPRIEAFES